MLLHRLTNTLSTGFNRSSSHVYYMRFMLKGLLEFCSKIHLLTANMISDFILQSENMVVNPTFILLLQASLKALYCSHLTSDKVFRLASCSLNKGLSFIASHLPLVLKGINRKCLIVQHGLHLVIRFLIFCSCAFSRANSSAWPCTSGGGVFARVKSARTPCCSVPVTSPACTVSH